MHAAHEDESLPLLLVRPARRTAPSDAGEDTPLRTGYRESLRGDRLHPGSAGACSGALAGVAGLGVVHTMHVARVGGEILTTTTALGIPADAAVPLAYLAAAIGGAIVGAGFATLTQHLRRFVPLVLWAIVVFVSVTMLLLAISRTYGHGFGVSMTPALLVASGVFAFVASFALPLRRRA